jgi:ATP-dependent DNA helicase RecQ
MGQPEEDADRLALAIAERAGALSIEPAAGGKIKVEFVGILDPRRAFEATEIAKQRGWDAYRAVDRFVSTPTCRRAQLLAHFGDTRVPAPSGRCCDVCDPPTWLPDLVRASASARTKSQTVAKRAAKSAAKSAPVGTAVEGGDNQLLEALRAWRKRAAGSNPAYVVAKNTVLEEIVRTLPANDAQLQAISGVGPAFVLKHGSAVLKMVAQYKEKESV